MFALRVNYLLGRSVATAMDDRFLTEWPPHPSRLFSALVAAHHAGGDEPAGRRALEWLEALAPPSIRAPSVHPMLAQEAYVPVNDVATVPEQRKRQARTFPRVGLGDDACVWYRWEVDPANHVEALRALTARVPYVGHSSSVVAMSVEREAPEPNLVPGHDGTLRLRVTSAGRLAALEDTYARSVAAGQRLQPPSDLVQAYRPAGPAGAPAVVPPRGQFATVIPFRIRGPRTLPLGHAVRLAEGVRAALMAQIATDIPAALSGHDEDGRPLQAPHLAIVPFGNVGHRHADGRVGGGALVLPPVDVELRRLTEAALAATTTLRLGAKGSFDLRPVSPLATAELPRYLRPQTYLTASRMWATITPMVFQRHPRNRAGRTTEEVVAEACVQAGLPPPLEVAVNSISHWTGAPAVREVLRREKTATGRYMAHVRLLFAEAVAGPVLLGAGRYFGYGFCRPAWARRGATVREAA